MDFLTLGQLKSQEFQSQDLKLSSKSILTGKVSLVKESGNPCTCSILAYSFEIESHVHVQQLFPQFLLQEFRKRRAFLLQELKRAFTPPAE